MQILLYTPLNVEETNLERVNNSKNTESGYKSRLFDSKVHVPYTMQKCFMIFFLILQYHTLIGKLENV